MSESKAPVSYDDTPLLPGSPWRVHDPTRPQPRVVAPGASPGQPPSDAVVLFDGSDLSHWESHNGESLQWRLVDGTLEAPRTKQNIVTRQSFGDCQLHVEWAAPAEICSDGQHRGNSGVFMMSRYEIQVLDSFQNPTYADGCAGAIYGQYPPLVNASHSPGQWQTYDIFFVAPRFDDRRRRSPAYLTVIHNGVLVQLHRALLGRTGHRQLPAYDEIHSKEAPLMLQGHGDAVRYRNLWIRPIEDHGWA